MHCVPDEMTNAAAQMQEKGEGASEEHDAAQPGFDHTLNGDIIAGSSGGCAQPHDQPDSA